MSKETFEKNTTDCVRDHILANSQRNPHAIALLAQGCNPLTYGHLADQIDYVGQILRARGVGRSDVVAVVLPNGPEMASAFLGIAAYATCAPLNPAYRYEELEFYLKDLSAAAIVLPAESDIPARKVAEQLGLAVFDLEPSTAQLSGGFKFRGAMSEIELSPDGCKNDDIALILHTSGTTSRPKQVPLSHGNLCSSARNITSILGLSPNDRCLNLMPLFHIHGLVGALLSTIFAGGSVVCTSGYSSNSFGELMGEFEPTWYSAVPTIHQSILELAKSSPAVAKRGNLRLIRSSSSALPPVVMAKLEEMFHVPVIESYGMTEAAHQMASNPPPPAIRKPGSVGRPAGPEMAIMDNDGVLLSAGETGEIVIRGSNVTVGYKNNPEANDAAFTNGWFRTGDLGRKDDAEYFFITGRIKEIINRGGEKISPREIDEVLLEHPFVVQAVTFAVPHPSLGEDVAVAVVLNGIDDVSEQDLRTFAFSRLADFKVPTQIVFVNDIPKGPTGKLQRIGLHKKLSPLLQAEFVAPENDVEIRLSDLWMELLNLSRVGRHDNFFACGGDSLLASGLVARMRVTFDVELSLPSVFHQPILYAQAILINEAIQAAKHQRESEVAELLDELDGLSEKEAARLLAESQSVEETTNAAGDISSNSAKQK